MCKTSSRGVPLVVLGAFDRPAALPLAAPLRGEGAIVLVAEGDRDCLRVATSVSPDIVLLDPRLSRIGLLLGVALGVWMRVAAAEHDRRANHGSLPTNASASKRQPGR
jgi:hypothetical protein